MLDRTTHRRTVLAAIAALCLGAVASGCVFMDDDSGPRVRGYTECGDFLGGATCSPGQYCADPGFSECALGCLSDVNCASNQACVKAGNAQIGVCENVVSSVATSARALYADVGVGADAFGGDAGR